MSELPERPARVVLVVPTYPPDVEAAGQRMARVARALRDQGAEVTVICGTNSPQYSMSPAEPGITVRRVAGSHGAGSGMQRTVDLARFGLGAAATLRRVPHDVVLVDPPPSNYHAVRTATRKPLVYYLADSWEELTDSRLGAGSRQARVVAVLERATLARSSATIAVNRHLGDVAEERAQVAGGVVVVPNGVPVPDGAPTRLPSGPPRFLYAGTIGLMQGADVFVEASKVLSASGFRHHCRFIGRGASFDGLYQRASGVSNIEVLPAIPPEKLAPEYEAATAVLVSHMPSPRLGHGVPVKALSALAAGRPLVYAGEGEFANTVTSQQLGLVADWYSPHDIAAKMRQVAGSWDCDPSALRSWVRSHHNAEVSASRVADVLLRQIPSTRRVR